LQFDLHRLQKEISEAKDRLSFQTFVASGGMLDVKDPRCSKIRHAKKTTRVRKPVGQHRTETVQPPPDLGPIPVFPESGLYLGLELAKNTGDQEIIETLDATGAVTNRLQDRNDPLGFGVVAGYNFVPWHNRVFVGPFASLDYLRQTINRNFAGGSFIGSTTNWVGNLGIKSGVAIQPGMSVYGLAGLGVLNEDLNINFGGPVTASNKTIPGFMLGAGGEWQPALLQRWGRPVSLFIQYQHTWWADAKLNAPISSPLFNYNFRRADDTIRFGVNFYFGAPPTPVAPVYPVKALPPK
jgi:opacity protein-like surface antigen